VKVILTPAARDFVSPLTLSTLSKEPVLSELFDEQSWANHVMLGRWADLMLIAPASCNSIAKMANAVCDNLLMATYLSATCPVWVAPAMDEDMWRHPATRENLRKIASYGHKVLPVEQGELASGLYGDGRMAEPHAILQMLQAFFTSSAQLKGRKALVTAGPTYEAIDPVRFIGNHSSGKMGIALAKELQARGAEVTLVIGPSSVAFDETGLHLRRVVSAEEMLQACREVFAEMDLAIMSAAVADYTPVAKAKQKIKKGDDGMQLELKRTTDILKTLGTLKRKEQVLIGFALETENELAHAKEKLEKKNADIIVLNSLNDAGAGFALDTNRISILHRDGQVREFETKPKEQVAKDIIDTLIEKYYA
jgi:phosphopantothenoylcysteine decarboxylase/phosphopantothenate--cysteine ligase